MTIETTPPPARRGSGALFGLVVGFLLGALVAALVVPKHNTTTTEAAAGDRNAGGGSSSAGGATGGGASSDAASAGLPGGDASASGGGGSTGGAASSSGGGGTGGASAAGTSGGATAGGAVRGVTPDHIVLGVAYPDLTALRALGPEYDNGDVPKQWNALIDGWRRQKLLPVAGRDITLKFQSFNVTDLQDQNRACRALINDDKVFAVIGVAYFQVGSDCVAREFRTPLISADGPTESVFARAAPFLFSLGMSENRMHRNLVHWADQRGVLKGHKLGVYYLDDAPSHEIVEQALEPELAKLGYKVAAKVATDQSLGGPQDAVAVQRFRQAGVDVALLLTSKAGFQQQAQAQAYKPTYIESDHDFGTSDVTTSTYPASQWTNTYGMTGRRIGESAAGEKLNADQEACVQNYERFSGAKVARPGRTGHESAEFSYILTDCDEGKILLTGLKAAGSALSPASLVAGIETMRNVPMLRYAAATFTHDKHHGGESQRTVVWRANCTCWVAEGGFGPLWVP